jgi:hypothetical protein
VWVTEYGSYDDGDDDDDDDDDNDHINPLSSWLVCSYEAGSCCQ